jgi:tetratricopeptide (TPR) repeat protein
MADQDIDQAEEFLRRQALPPPETFELALRLKAKNEFGYARELLERILTSSSDPALAGDIRRQLAFCVAKDPDLPLELRFDTAFEILSTGGGPASISNQASLGIAGSIYKAKWDALAQRQDLKTALGYYLRGYSYGIEGDMGYSASYAAYVLNLLADQELKDAERAGLILEDARTRIERAHQIRQEIVVKLSALGKQPGNETLSTNWRYLITVAAAHFGLKDYDKATQWLKKAMALPNISDLEYQAVARDLSALAMVLARPVDPAARAVVEKFLQDYRQGASTVFLGKAGLALSGGGFRASLYHIGSRTHGSIHRAGSPLLSRCPREGYENRSNSCV